MGDIVKKNRVAKNDISMIGMAATSLMKGNSHGRIFIEDYSYLTGRN